METKRSAEARRCSEQFVTFLVQIPGWRTTLCWLSGNAYSIYSRSPSVSGDRLLHPLRGRHIQWGGGVEEQLLQYLRIQVHTANKGKYLALISDHETDYRWSRWLYPKRYLLKRENDNAVTPAEETTPFRGRTYKMTGLRKEGAEIGASLHEAWGQDTHTTHNGRDEGYRTTPNRCKKCLSTVGLHRVLVSTTIHWQLTSWCTAFEKQNIANSPLNSLPFMAPDDLVPCSKYPTTGAIHEPRTPSPYEFCLYILIRSSHLCRCR